MLIKRNESGKHPIIVTDYQPCSDQKLFNLITDHYWSFFNNEHEAMLAIKAYLEKKNWFGQGCEHTSFEKIWFYPLFPIPRRKKLTILRNMESF